jgi:hypothetical protein
MATVYDWAFCDKDTGNIEYIMSVNDTSTYTTGGFYNGLRTIPVAHDSDHVKLMNESYYDVDDEIFKTRLKQSTRYYKWSANKKWELDSTQLMSEFREERNQKLGICDWTQGSDSPLSDDKKAEWATYRQALRDTTKNLKEDFDTPDGFAWPTAPS